VRQGPEATKKRKKIALKKRKGNIRAQGKGRRKGSQQSSDHSAPGGAKKGANGHSLTSARPKNEGQRKKKTTVDDSGQRKARPDGERTSIGSPQNPVGWNGRVGGMGPQIDLLYWVRERRQKDEPRCRERQV